MAEPLHVKILNYLKSSQYRPQRPQKLARELDMEQKERYHAFRDALRDLMREGRVVVGASGAVVLPTSRISRDEFVGTYRHNRRGFGFVVPSDPESHEDLFIPEGENAGALTGDVVRACITSTGHREGKAIYSGRITEIVTRTNRRFVGTLAKQGALWLVLPDGNALTEAILAPDAASRHIRPGSKVVVELTQYPENGHRAQGVITEVLGRAGEKDVDLKSIIIQFNLPGRFEEPVLQEARQAVDSFDLRREQAVRYDLGDQVICTVDPDDAKDYDDAISLKHLDNGQWELGVHIADVSHFVPEGSALDAEARARGNSCYFPGHVIPMLPEVLSNGICSLQERVPRLCKSAFITYDEDANPVHVKFANTIIASAQRLRYREAQALIDGAARIPHPEGDRTPADYPPQVVNLLQEMDVLARRIQKRRLAAGQLVLGLPEVELVLDDQGRVIDAVPEDQSFTHTIIEMFMVEANEAVARLLGSLDVPFLRRVHPDPEPESAQRLRQFAQVAGHRLPKTIDRQALQALLGAVKGRPEAFALNLAVLKTLTRAEYSPQPLGHYALASTHYCHFTSPIRRYADLTIHRLLGAYLSARELAEQSRSRQRRKKIDLVDVPSYDQCVELGRHLSVTERRAEDAERELRQLKLLTLLMDHLGEQYTGVVTGITNFGVFIQLSDYLIDGLIRYENLMDDWWDVDERSGLVRGQRSGTRLGIGDEVKVTIVRVDLARRELDLAVAQILSHRGHPVSTPAPPGKTPKPPSKTPRPRGGAARRGLMPKPRAKRRHGR